MRQLMLKLIMALHSEKHILKKKTDIGSTKLLSISPMTRDLLRPRGRSHAWPPGKRRNGLTTREGSLSAAKKTLRRVASKEHGRSTSPKPIPLTTSAWCLDDLSKDCSRVSFQKNDTKENNTVELANSHGLQHELLSSRD